MSTDAQTFGSISLIGRGVAVNGALRMSAAGINWKKSGGGRSVDVPAKDIDTMTYTQVPGGVVITVRRNNDGGEAVRLKGFRGGDLAGLKELCDAQYGVKLTKTEAQINGRNWGEVDLDRSGAVHFAVEGKTSFEARGAPRPLARSFHSIIRSTYEVMGFTGVYARWCIRGQTLMVVERRPFETTDRVCEGGGLVLCKVWWW